MVEEFCRDKGKIYSVPFLILVLEKKSHAGNCNYILLTKLPWPEDSKKTSQSSSQTATCPSVYHTRWTFHNVQPIKSKSHDFSFYVLSRWHLPWCSSAFSFSHGLAADFSPLRHPGGLPDPWGFPLNSVFFAANRALISSVSVQTSCSDWSCSASWCFSSQIWGKLEIIWQVETKVQYSSLILC